MHVTLRAVPEVRSLRDHGGAFEALETAFAQASAVPSSTRFRLVHFSVQHDHVHLIVEAHDRDALMRGLRGLAVRTAHALNRVFERRGRVWADRYHTHELTTPREVRNALVYVIHNARKHRRALAGVDPLSSGRYFDGWRSKPAVPAVLLAPNERAPVRPARTWLGSVGWRRHGLVGIEEKPRGSLEWPGEAAGPWS